jgi:phage terminase large subunit-like protein
LARGSNPLLWHHHDRRLQPLGSAWSSGGLAIKVLERTVVAEHVFAIIYTLDGPTDYADERKKGDDGTTNAIGSRPIPARQGRALDELEIGDRGEGKSPSQESEFKTKRLNMWLGAASAWLNVPKWMARSDPTLRLRDFRGLDCYLGADLADKDDITAVALAALDANGRLLLKTWFFLPEAALERESQDEKETVALYKQWKAAGHLWTTPGDFVDHVRVKRLVQRLTRALHARKLHGDQFAGFQIMASQLNDEFGDGEEAFAHYPGEEREEHDRPGQGPGGAGAGESRPAPARRQPGHDVDDR